MKIPKNNKTQPLPKQIIRAAKEIKDQSDKIAINSDANQQSEATSVIKPAGRTAGAGKKHNIKI